MKYQTMDFNEMSSAGLIWKINKEILHPLGLALARTEDETGNPVSYGCIIAPDGKWEYDEETNKRNQERYDTFLKKLNEEN